EGAEGFVLQHELAHGSANRKSHHVALEAPAAGATSGAEIRQRDLKAFFNASVDLPHSGRSVSSRKLKSDAAAVLFAEVVGVHCLGSEGTEGKEEREEHRGLFHRVS